MQIVMRSKASRVYVSVIIAAIKFFKIPGEFLFRNSVIIYKALFRKNPAPFKAVNVNYNVI